MPRLYVESLLSSNILENRWSSFGVTVTPTETLRG